MKEISMKRILRWSLACIIVFTTWAIVMGSGIAAAETGVINIDHKDNYVYGGYGATGAVSTNWSTFEFYKSGFNTVSEYYIIFNTNDTFVLAGNSTYFHCYSDCVGSGFAYYNKYGKIMGWIFDPGFTITGIGTHFSITYERNIFDSTYNLNCCAAATYYNTVAVNASVPMYVNVGGGSWIPGLLKLMYSSSVSSHYSSVGSTTNVSYSINYPFANKYSGSTGKSGVVQTKVEFENSTATQYSELIFNNISQTLPLLDYTTGLYINVSIPSGYHTTTLINSTNAIVSPNLPPVVNPATGVGIKFDYDTYSIGSIANISWLRTSPTPFLDTDYIVLIHPDLTEQEIVSSPPDAGYVKRNLGTSGTWKVEFRRSSVLFGISVLDSDTAIISQAQPAYIIVNSTIPAGKRFDVTFKYGFTPQTQSPTNGIYVMKDGVWTGAFNSTYPTPIDGNTEYTIQLAVGAIGEYLLQLRDLTKGVIATAKIEVVYGEVEPQKNITTSYISLDKSSYSLGEVAEVSYGINNANYSNYILYLEVYNWTKGTHNFYQTLVDQEGVTYALLLNNVQGRNLLSGANSMSIRAKNDTVNFEVVYENFTLLKTTAAGFGLSLSKDTACPGESVYASIIVPNENATFLVQNSKTLETKVKYILRNSTVITLKSLIPGNYTVSLIRNSDSSIQNLNELSISSCVVTTPIPTTATGVQLGNTIMNFFGMPAFWGLIIWILIVYGVASSGKTGQDMSKAIELTAVICAALEAIIGLWAPFTWWVVAILIIALGARFYTGAKVVKDGG